MGFSEVEVTLEEGEAQLFVYESKYGEEEGGLARVTCVFSCTPGLHSFLLVCLVTTKKIYGKQSQVAAT